jgi:hypothetical protein
MKEWIVEQLVKLGWAKWEGNVWIKDGRKATFDYAVAYELERLVKMETEAAAPTAE